MVEIVPLGRFPGIKASSMSAAQTAAVEPLIGERGVPSPFRFLVNSAPVAQHLGQLWLDIRKGKTLSAREREIVTLVTATEMKCDFVKVAHRKTGVSVGLPDDILDAMLSSQVPPLTDARERAVYDLTIALLRENPLPADKAARFEKALGNEAVSDVIGYIAIYVATAHVMRFVDLKPPA